MTKGKKKLFLDKETLYDVMMLRRAGWGFYPLAIMYNCDRTSIRDHARKYVVIPELHVFNPQRVVNEVVIELYPTTSCVEWTDPIEGQRICLGKSYADYLRDGR